MKVPCSFYFLIKLGLWEKMEKVFKIPMISLNRLINIRFIDDTTQREMQNKNLLRVIFRLVDFGCEESPLTFALHYYFM